MDETFAVRVVVVGQLLAFSNVARGADPDHALLDVDVAVRLAPVIDEARHVADHARIDDRPVGELEAPDMPALDVAPLALQAFLIGDELARVMNDPRVLGNACR